MFRDYKCILLADCAAEPIGQNFPRSNHAASLLIIESLLGWVSASQELVRALELQVGSFVQVSRSTPVCVPWTPGWHVAAGASQEMRLNGLHTSAMQPDF